MEDRTRDSTAATSTGNATTMRLLVEAIATEALLRAQDATYSQQRFHYGPPPPPPQYHQYVPPPPPFWHFVGLIPFLKKVITYITVGIVLSITSLVIYGVFYQSVMPELLARETLYFDYTGIARHPSVAVHVATSQITTATKKMNETDQQKKKKTKKESTAPIITSKKNDEIKTSSLKLNPQQQQQQALLRHAPWAAADLFSRHSHWDPGFVSGSSIDTNGDSGDDVNEETELLFAQHEVEQPLDVVPPLKSSIRILSSGTPHYLEVLLDLPESDHNRQIGLFGVHVQLQSSNMTTLASSMRTARLPHESVWVAIVRKVVCIFPLLIGALEESRRVTVPSFRYYVESRDMPLRFVTVRLVAPVATSTLRSHHREEKGHSNDMDDDHDSVSIWIENAPEVLRGHLHVGKELTAFQEILKEWFFTCMMAGFSFFFSIQVMAILAIRSYWEHRCEQKRRQQQQDGLDFDNASEAFSRHGFNDGRRHDHSTAGDDGEWEDMHPNQEIDSTQRPISVASVNEANSTSHQSMTSQINSIPREVQTAAEVEYSDARDYIPCDDDDDANWSSMSPQIDGRGTS
jgi:Putative adipose-regulatory protein (Seipin)